MRNVRTYLLVLTVLVLAQSLFAASDITFSSSKDNPGSWSYTTDGYISFVPVIEITSVCESSASSLVGCEVWLPVFKLEDGNTKVVPQGALDVVNSTTGETVFSCSVAAGLFNTFYTVSMTHADVAADLEITYLNSTCQASCPWLAGLAIGDEFDLNIAMTSDVPFDQILDIQNASNSAITGSMTLLPEPMTISILALGSIFLIRRKR